MEDPTFECNKSPKQSSSSPNKYMAEAEKCSTPGSVAERRAYFEAHYRKIAAQSAEMFEQEQRMPTSFLSFSDRNQIKSSTSAEYKRINCAEPTKSQKCNADNGNDGDTRNNVKKVAFDSNGKESTELNKSDVNTINQRPKEMEEYVLAKKPLNEGPDGLHSNELVEESKIAELSKESDCNEDGSQISNPSVKDEKESNADNLSLAGNPDKVYNRSTTTKQKKVAPGGAKQAVTQLKKDKLMSLAKKSSKEIPNKDEMIPKVRNMTASKPSTTKANARPVAEASKSGISLSSGKTVSTKPAVTQDKASHVKSTKKQLAGPASPATPILRRNFSTKEDITSAVMKCNSDVEKRRSNDCSRRLSVDSSLPMTSRRYSIMEQMGDKDIVRRAFRTFRNTFQPSRAATDRKSMLLEQMTKSESGKNPQSAPAVLKDNNRRNNSPTLASQRRQTSTPKPAQASSPAAAQWK